jgi:hypothetical protein
VSSSAKEEKRQVCKKSEEDATSPGGADLAAQSQGRLPGGPTLLDAYRGLDWASLLLLYRVTITNLRAREM